MINFLEETKKELERNGKNIFDVLWLGTKEFAISNDIQQLFSFDYDNGYGGTQIPDELIVVGVDWWMERQEYDGGEWWEFKQMPTKPAKERAAGSMIEFRLMGIE
jgi:hypothetical protein